jgi:hypothetical protein
MTSKLDLYGKPLVVERCLYCGKVQGEHKANTRHCPEGRKHRTFGYSYFHATNTFTPKRLK